MADAWNRKNYIKKEPLEEMLDITFRMSYAEYSEYMEMMAANGIFEKKEPYKKKPTKGNAVCKYCGNPNLVWEELTSGSWILLDSEGFKHNCFKPKAKELIDYDPYAEQDII